MTEKSHHQEMAEMACKDFGYTFRTLMDDLSGDVPVPGFTYTEPGQDPAFPHWVSLLKSCYRLWDGKPSGHSAFAPPWQRRPEAGADATLRDRGHVLVKCSEGHNNWMERADAEGVRIHIAHCATCGAPLRAEHGNA